jgi:hypothetical protein
VDSGFARVDARLDAMQHTMIQVGGAMIVALVGVLATLIALIATKF